MQIRWFSNSGNHGSENSDSVHISGAVVAIADGMGGLPSAKSAAELVTKQSANMINSCIENNCFDEECIHDVIGAVNESLRQKLSGSGATLSILVLSDDQIWCASIGDSKIFAFFEMRFLQISTDENLYAKTGLKVHQKILTNYLGKDDILLPRISKFRAKLGDLFVLCTDGLSDVIDIQGFLESCEQLDQHEMCQLLENQARKQAPKDDYSAIIVSIE